MDEDNFVDQETLSSVRAGLIIVDHESSVVRLAHYTTPQYFEIRRELLFQDAQSRLAVMCLTYLLFDDVSHWLNSYSPGRTLNVDSRDPGPARMNPGFFREGRHYGHLSLFHRYVLIEYTSCHWSDHARPGWDETVKRLTLNILGRKRHLAASLCFQYWDRERKLLEESFFPSGHSGISIAAYYGLTDTVEAMLNLANLSKDQDESTSHAIGLAVLGEQMSPAQMLLNRNAVTLADMTHALHCAARARNEEIMGMLIVAGADVNGRLVKDGPTALY